MWRRSNCLCSKEGARSPGSGINQAYRLLQYKSTKRINCIPSNVHISTPFFRKTVFFFKICFGNILWKFLGVCLNSEFMWQWIPVHNLRQHAPSKSCFSPLSNLPPLCQTPTHGRISFYKSFYSDMPSVDTFCVINKTGAYHINAFKYPYNFFWLV